MAYFSKNGNGIDSNAYIYVQLQVTRTDYPTYSRFSVKSVAVSDTGTSSFIRGQVTTNQGGTSWTAATGWKSVSYNGTTTLATATFDVARGSADKTAHIGGDAEGVGTGIYSGGTDYATLYVTVPKVLSPNAPTGCTATYVSDSQASVSWTNGTADTDHPRDATLVERRDGSNEWAQVASVSGTASSYTDNGISPNGQYQYRVRAKNAAGYSAYSTGGSIYTTPATPASVTLDKTAATTVQVNATGTWVYAVTYDVELTYDGGATWSTVATSTSLPYSATVSGGTVQFRVRATRGALASAWTLSDSLVTVTPPLAPTIVQAPANPSAYGEQAEVAWTPNHPDGSSQVSAEIKITNPGGTSTTYTVTTATSYQLTPNATGTWTAQVRTKGLDPSYGEWSQAVSWAVANPPAVVITSPATDGTDINALPMTVSWTVTDSTGVSTQRIIIEGGSEILNRTLAGDVRTLSLTASDVDLVDGETYTIRIRVMGGSGLVTEQTRTFDVSWLAPTAPLLQITEGEGESASIDVMSTTYPESGTVLEASSVMMESLTIHGKSQQDGTPTPSAPVPIESVDNPVLYVRGFNLWDEEWTNGYFGSDGTWSANSSIVASKYPIPVEPNTAYYLKNGNGASTYVTTWEHAYVAGTSAPVAPISRGSNTNAVFVTPPNCHYIHFNCGSAYGGTYRNDICINLSGSRNGEYVPFNGSTTPIPVTLRSLPDGTHDELRVGERKVLVKRVGRAVIDGVNVKSVSTIAATGSGEGVRHQISLLADADTSVAKRPVFYSEAFYPSGDILTASKFRVGMGLLYPYSSTANFMVVLPSECTTAALGNDWFAANPVEVLYPLATTQEIDLGAVDLPYVDGSAWVDAEVTPQIEATFRPVDFPDQPAADSVDVIRVNADGTTWTVASGLSVGDTAIDPLPPLGVTVEYRAVGTAPSGATSSGSYTETIGGREWVLNFGNAAQEHIEFVYNPQADLSLKQGGTPYHFADGGKGRGLPVFYPTTDRDYAGSLRFDTILYGDTDKVLDLCDRYPVAWLRDPFGHRWRAQVSPSVSHGVGQIWPVTLSWDAMRFEEAWDG